jgi:hypothetical protein
MGRLPAAHLALHRRTGLLLANAFLAAFFWLVASWGWLPIENVAAISWLSLFSVAAILAVGMSWSHWRRARPS